MKIQNIKNERLNLLFLKNTIAIFVPSIIVFVIILLFTNAYPIIYYMMPHSVTTLEEMEQRFDQGCYNVQMTVSEMKYTGYDYYEDGKRTGAYYYSFIENKCVFFLMQTKNPKPVIEDRVLRGIMLDNSASLEAMLNGFAKDLRLPPDAFHSFVNPIMVSEVEYPRLKIFLVVLLVIIPYVAAALLIVLSVLWTIQPFRHPSAKQLIEFGERKLVFEELRSQMKNRLLQHNYNYYITEEYLVISNWFTTDVIRIDFIRYISRHVIKKANGKQVYRLTMSNPEKMFYEKDFSVESCADEIMTKLIELNPHIDNRTMNVFRLSEPEMLEQETTENAEQQVMDSEKVVEMAEEPEITEEDKKEALE